MSIKKSQAPILKYFIDLKFSVLVYAGLRRSQKTKPCFVTLRTFFSSTAGQGFQNTKKKMTGFFTLSNRI